MLILHPHPLSSPPNVAQSLYLSHTNQSRR
ncbi:Uncharacterised protein [Vibrio cholerae]|nr:Uncharacterised protein [Vibrio cholerae]